MCALGIQLLELFYILALTLLIAFVFPFLIYSWKSVLNNHSEYVSDTSDYETIMRMLDATKVNPLYSSTTVVVSSWLQYT